MNTQPNPYQNPTGAPPPAQSSGNNSWLLAVLGAFAAIGLVCAGLVGVGLLLPAVQAAREAARRTACSNNQKQIALALSNYETVWGSLPPAYTEDENGQRLHSWRTLILPYLEQQALYEQIDLSEPWDAPVNQPFNEIVVEVYSCPSMASQNRTPYVAVVDPRGVFTGSTPTRLRDITDGTSNTLLIVEVDSNSAVEWMSPEDVDSSAFPSVEQHRGVCNCSMADGSVHAISENIDPNMADALITKAGAETIALP